MIQPNQDFLAPGLFSHERSDAPASSPAPAAEPTPPSGDKAELIDLVRRATLGEAAAQAELVRRYSRRITGFVRSIIGQSDAVEDVTQMVFIKMFRRLGRLRDPAVFESWLFTLARNSGLDFIRRRRCRPSTVAIDDQVCQIADPSTGDGTAEILAALDRALTRLAPLDRALVTQYVAGDSYGEIAKRAGLSLSSVKVRLHRVRPFLRTWVGEMTDTRQRGGRGWRSTAGNRSTVRGSATSRLAA